MEGYGGREAHLVNVYQSCSWGNGALFFGILVSLTKYCKVNSKGSLRKNVLAFWRKVGNLGKCQEQEKEETKPCHL